MYWDSESDYISFTLWFGDLLSFWWAFAFWLNCWFAFYFRICLFKTSILIRFAYFHKKIFKSSLHVSTYLGILFNFKLKLVSWFCFESRSAFWFGFELWTIDFRDYYLIFICTIFNFDLEYLIYFLIHIWFLILFRIHFLIEILIKIQIMTCDSIWFGFKLKFSFVIFECIYIVNFCIKHTTLRQK